MKTTRRRIILALCSGVLLGLWQSMSVAAQPLNITVYGGTGRIGQRIVDEALSRGHIVTVVVRNPSPTAAERARLTVIKGDILDTRGVAEQMAGQDAVVSAVSGFNLGEDFFPKVAQSLVTAARGVSGNAPRILWVGGSSSLPEEPGGQAQAEINPKAFAFQKGKLDALKYFGDVKDIPWTILNPPTNIEPGTRTNKFRIGTDVLLKDAQGESRISMEDFAVALLDEIERPKHVQSQFTVAY
jgi:hypothetical protein